MKKEDVPFYKDPEGFDDGSKFPCNTEYMKYDTLRRRYYLTPEGAIKHGIDTSEFENDNFQRLLEKATKKIYEFINYKVGISVFEVMVYRIAAAPKIIYTSQYAMRKDFEEILVNQVKWLIANDDSAEVSDYRLDKQEKPLSPDEEYRDNSDIAKEAIRTLETLRLTRWFQLGQFVRLDQDKY